MKRILSIIFILLFLGCSDKGSLNKDSLNKERTLPLPPPPDSLRHVIHYNGKTIIIKSESELKRFLDSLNIKDTIIGHIE